MNNLRWVSRRSGTDQEILACLECPHFIACPARTPIAAVISRAENGCPHMKADDIRVAMSTESVPVAQCENHADPLLREFWDHSQRAIAKGIALE